MATADKLIDLFDQARSIPNGEARREFLRQACGTDLELEAQVVSLIDAHQGAGDFLAAPARPAATCVHETIGDVIDHYRLREILGEGGCGVVYLAEQEHPVRRTVALKLIRPGMDTRAVVTRFETERQVVAMMDHPNIARILDAGTTASGRPYFVMEWVQGLRITDYCDRNKLTIPGRLQLFTQVCHAVEHAHQKGIIHRDLKPSNVLVAVQNSVPVPKVIDFGIAKATQGPLADAQFQTHQLHAFVGTPAYMSPEQAQSPGGDIDTRSDVYSLGALLYELLAGRPPFDPECLASKGFEGVLSMLLKDEPLGPSAQLAATSPDLLSNTATHRSCHPAVLVRQLRGDLDWIVLRCLEKDRGRRYSSAGQLAADIERHRQHQVVEAGPPSNVYKARKAFRRHRVLFLTATAVAMSLIIGLLTSLWQAARASRAREEADAARGRERDQRLEAQRESHKARQAMAESEHRRYADKMHLARLAWEENNLERLRQLLHETADNPDRGPEWYWWQHRTHLEQLTLRGHLAPVSAVAFSPDGRRILTGSFDRTARIWDADSGSEQLVLRGHYGVIRALAWSHDGRHIITAAADRTARLWDAANGRELLRFEGHADWVVAVAFSPDNRTVATGSYDGTARLWDRRTGHEQWSLPHDGRVWTVAFSSDGQQLLTGASDETATLWATVTGEILRVLPAPITRIRGRDPSAGAGDHPFTAALSPDGRQVLTGSRDQTARLWDLASGGHPASFPGAPHWISPLQYDVPFPVAFSPDCEWIVTGGLDRTATVWSTGTATRRFTLKGHEAEVSAVAVSPDGTRIVTGGNDNTARVWEASHSRESMVLDGFERVVPTASFSADGTRVVAGSWDGTARVYDSTSGRHLRTLRHGPARVWTVAFSHDGRRILTGGDDGVARIWDWEASSDLPVLEMPGHDGPVMSAAFYPNDRRIVTGAEDGRARVWDALNGRLEFQLEEAHRLVQVAVSSDGRRLATTSESPIASTDGHHLLPANPDGTVNRHFQGSANVWDADTGRHLFPLVGHGGGVSTVAFSQDGTRIGTGSMDGTARIWDAASGRHQLTLEGHSGRVIRLAFSRDGRRVITGGFDNLATKTRVWDTERGFELLHLPGQLFLALSPDGSRLVTGAEPPLRMWKLASTADVARWRGNEQAAADRIEAGRRSRLALARQIQELDPKTWLTLGPIPFDGVPASLVDVPMLPDEPSLHPRAGQTNFVAGRPYVWQLVAMPDFKLDLSQVFGRTPGHHLAYAVCYLISDSARDDLVLHVGSDNEAVIHLNGKAVYSHLHPRDWHPDQDAVPGIRLNTGVNVLVFKVGTGSSQWRGSIRLTDAAGLPVPGVRATSDATGQE